MATPFTAQLVALLPRLRRFACGLAGAADQGDDLVQEACERAILRQHQFEPGTRLDSWMFRIIQNLWVDRQRAGRRRGPTVEIGEADTVMGADGESDAAAAVDLARVRRCIAELPEEQQAVLLLVCVDGLSYREAADTLELPIGTVMSRLARARQRLYAMLNPGDEL